jgi:tetrahydromethanopterin S-methyltransferase subunit E
MLFFLPHEGHSFFANFNISARKYLAVNMLEFPFPYFDGIYGCVATKEGR